MMIPLLRKLTLSRESRRCSHSHADGSGCKATPQRGREYCFFHDPTQRERREVANRTGGAHSRRRKRKRVFNPLRTPAEVGAFVRELMNDVRNGDVGVRRANTLARLTPVVLGIIEQENKVIEQVKQEAWAAAEAERAAVCREMVAERLREHGACAAGEAEASFAPIDVTPVLGDCSQSRLEASGASQVDDIFSSTHATSGLHANTAGDGPRLAGAGPRLAGAGSATRAIQPDAVAIADKSDDKASGNDEAAVDPYPIVPFHCAISGAPMRRSALAPRTPKRYESKDVFIGQTFPVDVARTKLDVENEALRAAQNTIAASDMAQKKLDAQELALKKEIAYALAPTTMKSSVITDEGVAAATSGTSPTTTQPVRNRDYEPSPIPGLQNRHLNYLKFAGMPVSELQRSGFIPSRWHSKFVRR